MSVFVTGDTHGWLNSDKLFGRDAQQLTKDDYLIIAGDAGFIWHHSKIFTNLIKVMYKDLPYTILFVDGNHENFDLLNAYKLQEFCGGQVHKINDKLIHLTRGQVFNLQGKKFFTFGGARSTDKAYRTPNLSWWEAEMPNFAEQEEGFNNLEKYNYEVDYVVTHDMPYSSLVRLIYKDNHYIIENDNLRGYLDTIKSKIKYDSWFCGHYHIDKKIEEDNIFILYNNLVKIF